jgi:hypothetical protein
MKVGLPDSIPSAGGGRDDRVSGIAKIRVVRQAERMLSWWLVCDATIDDVVSGVM